MRSSRLAPRRRRRSDGGLHRPGDGRNRGRNPAGLQWAWRPVNKISIQLWTFAEYIGFGTDAATIARTEEVFRRLSAMGTATSSRSR